MDSLNPHSCIHCRNIIIEIDRWAFPSWQMTYTFDDVAVLATDCAFFRRMLDFATDRPIPTRRGYEHFNSGNNMTAKSGDRLELYLDGYEELEACWRVSNPDQFIRHRLYLNVFTKDDDAAAAFVKSRPLTLSKNRPEDLQRYLTYFQDCLAHESCFKAVESSDQAAKPTRLLYVADDACLCLYTVLPGECPPYAALSYCWGQTPQQEQARSVTANIQDRQKNIDPSQLPQTVRDAIRVARALTLSFLWVDALCIIQDDKSEMQMEITKMAGVYQNAAITIVAASAKSSVEGFLGDRDLKAAYGQVFQLSYEFINDDHQAQGSVMLSERSIRDEYEEPIDSRAWTMQEDILSVRLLRFGLTQTTWRCPSVYKTIDGGSSPSLHFKGFNFTKSGAFQDNDHKLTESEYRLSHGDASVDNELWMVWQGSIEDYTTRAISNPEDTLTACAAFAEKFASTRILCSTDYLAGLWKDDIYAQLLWYRVKESDATRSSGSRRSSAPTWSWASVNGPVHFYDRYFLMDTNSIVQASARLDDDRMLYRRQGRGYAEVGPACLWLNGTLQRVHHDGRHVKQGTESASSLALTTLWDSPEDQFDQTLWCFEVIRTAQGNRALGLLLARTEREEFLRVGCFEIDEPSVNSWLAKGERQTVAIV